jgi:superfamily I DNA/RNA helicase
MNLTLQQQAFIDAVRANKSHLCLRARAGTGKTSTILAATGVVVRERPAVEVAICAFNKAVQLEITDKLVKQDLDWRSAAAVTTHSMGFGLLRNLNKDIKFDNGKVKDLILAEDDPFFRRNFTTIAELVHLAKLEGFGAFEDRDVDDTEAWQDMADHFGVSDGPMDNAIKAAQHIYRKSLVRIDICDFDDMVLLPLVRALTARYRKDYVFLDEAQDTSRARRALVKKFLKPNGKLVIVGDDRQAIYGFAGASPDALDELVQEMSAEVLPLTMTWRCPRSVVELAQEFVPDIEAADTAQEGTISHTSALPEGLRPTDSILCRNTAPLVAQAYRLIREGVACKVEGRDIGAGLVKMVDRWKHISKISPFLDQLNQWEHYERERAIAKGDSQRLADVEDRCETMRVVCDAVAARGGTTLDYVKKFITELFADNVKGMGMLTLATMHRAKGREWQRVILLDYDRLCPSPYARKEWQLRQEHNLMYVGITRSMSELMFCDRPRQSEAGAIKEGAFG